MDVEKPANPFEAKLDQDPKDLLTREVYAEWLEEHGDLLEAETQRLIAWHYRREKFFEHRVVGFILCKGEPTPRVVKSILATSKAAPASRTVIQRVLKAARLAGAKRIHIRDIVFVWEIATKLSEGEIMRIRTTTFLDDQVLARSAASRSEQAASEPPAQQN